jgi:hypothetical protein
MKRGKLVHQKMKKMKTKDKIQNHKLIMFVMLWLLLAAIIIGLLLKGQALLVFGFLPIGYCITVLIKNR